MARSKVDYLTVTVVDRQAETNEEKFKTVELHGKAALQAIKALKGSQYLSGRVANVLMEQKINPETKAPTEGLTGVLHFMDDAAGNKVEVSKERRYKVDINRITFETENQGGKAYTVSKPVNRDKEGNVTNLVDADNGHGKIIGVKSILDALNDEGECFLFVEKTKIGEKDTWVIKDANQLTGASADQRADQPKYSITVTAATAGMVNIAGPEIKDSEDLKNYIKTDLGGKWDAKGKVWNAPLPEGMSAGKLFYQVIDKARELGVTPAPSMNDIAKNAPAGASLADAAAAVSQKSPSQSMNA